MRYFSLRYLWSTFFAWEGVEMPGKLSGLKGFGWTAKQAYVSDNYLRENQFFLATFSHASVFLFTSLKNLSALLYRTGYNLTDSVSNSFTDVIAFAILLMILSAEVWVKVTCDWLKGFSLRLCLCRPYSWSGDHQTIWSSHFWWAVRWFSVFWSSSYPIPYSFISTFI